MARHNVWEFKEIEIKIQTVDGTYFDTINAKILFIIVFFGISTY